MTLRPRGHTIVALTISVWAPRGAFMGACTGDPPDLDAVACSLGRIHWVSRVPLGPVWGAVGTG